jgi:transposase
MSRIRQPLGQGATGEPGAVKIKRNLENHVRGLLKNLGLVIGRAKFNVFAVRAEELTEGRPELVAAIRPLLEYRRAAG